MYSGEGRSLQGRRGKALAGSPSLMSSEGQSQRGILLVLEGADRVGKSTQTRKLVQWLQSNGTPTAHVSFPERDAPGSGALIQSVLDGSLSLPPAASRLLFCVNRHQAAPRLHKLLSVCFLRVSVFVRRTHITFSLKEGVTVIVDRYVASGVVYGMAQSGKLYETAFADLKAECLAGNQGLPAADATLLLSLPTVKAATRPGFGSESLETPELQVKLTLWVQ